MNKDASLAILHSAEYTAILLMRLQPGYSFLKAFICTNHFIRIYVKVFLTVRNMNLSIYFSFMNVSKTRKQSRISDLNHAARITDLEHLIYNVYIQFNTVKALLN